MHGRGDEFEVRQDAMRLGNRIGRLSASHGYEIPFNAIAAFAVMTHSRSFRIAAV